MLSVAFPSLDMGRDIYKTYVKSAAEAGVPEAENEYAYMLMLGFGTNKNSEEAIQYLLRAAQSGYARAQYKLAREFLSGRAIETDEVKAKFWLEQAAEQGEQYAQFWLARLLIESDNELLRDPDRAKALLASVKEQQSYNPNWYYYAASTELHYKNKERGLSVLNEGKKLAKNYGWQLNEFNALSEQFEKL